MAWRRQGDSNKRGRGGQDDEPWEDEALRNSEPPEEDRTGDWTGDWPEEEPPASAPKKARVSTISYDSSLSDGPKDIDERTVWIGKLPPTVTSKFQIAEGLAQFGQVVHVHIKADLSHGFAHFDTKEGAEAALGVRTFPCGGTYVEIRKANARSAPTPAAEPDEAVDVFRGRFEKFRKGHGFLRPLEKSAEDAGAQSGPVIDQGVYVSQSQVERFGLLDGDLVEAYVRPPRDKDHRNVRVSRSAGESSWAIVRVVSVNGTEAEQCDRGPREERFEGNADATAFEWIGRVEMWRMASHGFLRPLNEESPQEYRDLLDPAAAEAVGPGGVFIPKEAMERHQLLDGDIVRALVRRPAAADGPSCTLVDVVDVLLSAPADEAASTGREPKKFRGVFESFRRGHGFVRPIPEEDATAEDMEINGDVLEPWLEKGVYVSVAFVQRFDLKNGQKVTVICRPPGGGDGEQKSAITMDVVTKDTQAKTGGAPNGDDAELPPELAHLDGIRIHGAITKLCPEPGTWSFGWIRPDHRSIKSDVFFHKNDIQSWRNWGPPKLGDAAFFKVKPNKVNSKGELTLRAIEVNFNDGRQQSPSDDGPMAEFYRTSGMRGAPPPPPGYAAPVGGWGWVPPPPPGGGPGGWAPPPPPGWAPPPGHAVWQPSGFPGWPAQPGATTPGPRAPVPAPTWTTESSDVVAPSRAKKPNNKALLDTRSKRPEPARAAEVWTPSRGAQHDRPWMPGQPSQKRSSYKRPPEKQSSRPAPKWSAAQANDEEDEDPVEEEEVELTDEED